MNALIIRVLMDIFTSSIALARSFVAVDHLVHFCREIYPKSKYSVNIDRPNCKASNDSEGISDANQLF